MAASSSSRSIALCASSSRSDADYWAEFLRAIAQVNPEMNVNIEHEDAEYGNVEGLQISAKNLLEAAALV